MATIDTFKQQAKYTTQTVQVNYLEGLQIYKENFYRRPIVVNNTGKTVKTNYYISVQIKHFDLYLNYKSNYNFSDLRVYDTDGVTELEFAVQNQMSTNTLIFIKIPSIAAASKTIYIEYGNNGLNSKNLELDKPLQSVTFWNFNKTKFRDWFIAQNIIRSEQIHFRGAKFVNGDGDTVFTTPTLANANGSYLNSWPITNAMYIEPLAGYNATNFRSKFNSAHAIDTNRPVVRCNEWDPTMSINGLDTLEFMSETLYTNSLNIDPLDEYRNFYSFFVIKPTAIGSIQYIFAGHELGGKSVQITAAGKIEIVTEGTSTIAQHTATLAANTNYIVECSLQWTGGTGYNARIRVNGAEETFTGTNAGMSTNFKYNKIGNSRAGTSPFSGYLAEFGWCDGFNTSSVDDTAFRTSIYEYLNTKYRIVGSDFPTITLGTETTLTPFIYDGYVSNSTFADVNYRQKLSNDFYGLGSSDTKISFKDNLQKVWLAGNETFDNSTLDSSGKFLSTKYSQAYSASSSSTWTAGRFDHIFSANNIKNLNNYETKDIFSNIKYMINDEDYITLDIHIDNVNVNYAGSVIEFSDTNSFVNRRTSSLTGQYFTIGLNTINIKKSEFGEVNTLTWDNAIYVRIKVVMLTGQTANVYFGYGRVLKNYEKLITKNAKLIIGDAVSDDQFATSYNAVKNIVTVTDVLTSDGGVELKTKGVLEDFYSRKFSELPGFPTDGRPLYIGSEPFAFPSETIHFKNFVLKQLFCLAFPYSILDFEDIDADLTLLSAELQIFGQENVRDRISEILAPMFSSIYFDDSTGKITFRSGKKLLSQVPTKFVTKGEIIEYKTNTISDIAKVNNVSLLRHRNSDSRNSTFGGEVWISTILGFGGKFDEIGAFKTKDFFYEYKTADENRKFLEYTRVADYNFATTNDPTVPGVNNSGLKIRSIRFLYPSTIVITVQNQLSVPRYFYALNLQSAFSQYTSFDDTQSYKNETSIKNYGEEIIDLPNKLFFSSGVPVAIQNFWQGIVDRFGENQRKYELEINNRKDLLFEENTAFFDNKNLLVQGNIIATSENVANKRTIEILASTIRPVIT